MQSSEEARVQSCSCPASAPHPLFLWGQGLGERAGNPSARMCETVHTRFCRREKLCKWSQYLKHERRVMILYGIFWWVCRNLLQLRRFGSCIIACESKFGISCRNLPWSALCSTAIGPSFGFPISVRWSEMRNNEIASS